MGDEDMAAKYEGKIEVVKGNIEKDKAEKAASEAAMAVHGSAGLLN
jgi:hypothetical protein